MPQTTSLSLPDRDNLASPFGMLHHVAMVTNNMERTVAFYRDVLGSDVAMAHRLDREDEARHYFITVAPNTVFAFFEYTDAETPEYAAPMEWKTKRHLDHICFFVDSEEELDAWKERLEAHDVPVSHYAPGKNLFFPDPNNIVFQISLGSPAPMGFPVHGDPRPAYE